jgi:predicted Zn-dependent protease with MMP-like domain
LAVEEEKIRLNLGQFEALACQALKEIPQEFLEKLENLEIVVEEEPSPELLKELGVGERDLLFGFSEIRLRHLGY